MHILADDREQLARASHHMAHTVRQANEIPSFVRYAVVCHAE